MKTEDMTQENFDDVLKNEILPKHTSASLLNIPGIYEILAEEFNNDVIRLWNQRPEPVKAMELDSRVCDDISAKYKL